MGTQVFEPIRILERIHKDCDLVCFRRRSSVGGRDHIFECVTYL